MNLRRGGHVKLFELIAVYLALVLSARTAG